MTASQPNCYNNLINKNTQNKKAKHADSLRETADVREEQPTAQAPGSHAPTELSDEPVQSPTAEDMSVAIDVENSESPADNASSAETADGAKSSKNSESTENSEEPKKRTPKQWVKYFANRYFIEAFTGMALGLFCTLIIGTIIGQIGSLIGENAFGQILYYIGYVGKLLMGAGIGVGIAHSLKAKKLTSFSAAVAGMVGANITNIFALSGVHIYGASSSPSITIGDPVGAFVAAVAAIEIADLVEGKTPVDIIVVPLTAIAAGTLCAIALGIPFGILFALLGKGVSLAIGWEPISFGILIAVIMGLLLTLPTSSAAFGIMIFNSSLINTPELQQNALIGAAAACAGCCAHMVGFAAASFRENGWGGVVSQGIGTSMLQIPNIGKNPRILIPPVIASAVTGPLASAAFKIMCDATGSGMGTAGLVGVIETFITSLDNGIAWWYVLIAVLVCYIIVPIAIALPVSELMRKKGWIKKGDMKLNK